MALEHIPVPARTAQRSGGQARICRSSAACRSACSVLLQHLIETAFRDLRLSAPLIVFGLVLGAADRVNFARKVSGNSSDLTVGHAVGYGLAQALALIPGRVPFRWHHQRRPVPRLPPRESRPLLLPAHHPRRHRRPCPTGWMTCGRTAMKRLGRCPEQRSGVGRLRSELSLGLPSGSAPVAAPWAASPVGSVRGRRCGASHRAGRLAGYVARVSGRLDHRWACHAGLLDLGGWAYDEVHEVTFHREVELVLAAIVGPSAVSSWAASSSSPACSHRGRSIGKARRASPRTACCASGCRSQSARS